MTSNKALIQQYLAAYTAFDIPGMLALLAPDVVFENYTSDQLTASAQGIEEFRTLAEQSRGLFAEREVPAASAFAFNQPKNAGT